MQPIRFGTEGWRAIPADEYTFENVRAVARATGMWVKEEGLGTGVAIGHDTRFMGARFAQLTADELAGCGLEAHVCEGPLPTPALDYYLVKNHLAGGVMLTASHNPAEYNGFKVKRSQGCSAFEEEAKWIEREANALVTQGTRPTWAPAATPTRYDVRDDYVTRLVSLVDAEAIRKAKLTVVADMMHGAGGGFFDEALRRAGCTVHALRGDPSPTFEGRHPEPLGPNLVTSCQMTGEAGVDLGVATDGDADRFGMMAHGEYLDVMRAIVYLLYHLLKNRGWRGTVIRAANVTSMLDRLCEHFGVTVIETSVGFKNIAPLMLKTEDVILGVEESGGFGIRGHLPDRDGSLAALIVCEARAIEGKPVGETLDDIFTLIGGRRAFNRLDVRLTPEQQAALAAGIHTLAPEAIAGQPVVKINRIDGAKYFRKDGSWVMLRLSGTEPLVRIYGEAMSPEEVQALLEAGRTLVQSMEA